jgi:NitT/TauT family transport system permease protein
MSVRSAQADLGVVLPVPAARQRGFAERHRSRIRAVASILVVFVLWELVGRFVITNRLFFVPLSSVFEAGTLLWARGQLQVHLWTSSLEFVIGFGAAAVTGIALGAAMAVRRPVRDYLDPWVAFLYATPTVALAPLFILWFKLGIESKVAVIWLVAIFPILLNTLTGIEATDPDLIEAARSFGARPLQIFRKVMLPSALPFIVTGIRLGLARGLVGVVVAEFFGSKAGLGYLILFAAGTFDMATLFVGVLILALAGVVSTEALKALEVRLAPWRSLRAAR